MSQRLNYLSKYYHIDTSQGPLHVHIDYTEEGPKQLFARIPPAGSERATYVALVSLLITKLFRAGCTPEEIINQLKSIKGDKRLGKLDDVDITSIPQAIAMILKRHTEEAIKEPEDETENDIPTN